MHFGQQDLKDLFIDEVAIKRKLSFQNDNPRKKSFISPIQFPTKIFLGELIMNGFLKINDVLDAYYAYMAPFDIL